jgi:soluble lytic murein transglycosylase-like protein
MSLMEKKFKNRMIFISRPAGILLMILYSLQMMATILLIWSYLDQKEIINKQAQKIREMEEKLKILEIIEDYQIGFNEDEVAILTNVIYDESVKFGIDPLLILAVIRTESAFKRHQKSHVGAEGLMQIMPRVGKSVAEKWGIKWPEKRGLWNPNLNVKLGTAYLFELIIKFKDVRKAIIAYNLGEGVTREYFYLGATPPAKYYNRVKANYLELRKQIEDNQDH